MKRDVLHLCLCSIIISLYSQPLLAKSSRFTHTIDVRSRYIWRGLDFYDDNAPAFQYTLNYDMGDSGTKLGLFTSFALDDRSVHKEWEEADLFIEHDFPKKNGVQVTAGLLCYFFPNMEGTGWGKTTSLEYYFKFAFEKLPWEPTLTVAYDGQMGNGTYGSLTFSRLLGKSENSFDLETSIGYNDHHWTTGTGWSEWNVSLSKPIFENTTLTFGYTRVFLDSINRDDNEAWLGVSYEF